MAVIISSPARMHLMGCSCLGVIEKEAVHEDSGYRVSCSLIPQTDRPQSNQTPDLWLKLQSVWFRSRREKGGRLSHNKSGKERVRIKGLLSLPG